MATCVVSGTLVDPSTTPISGASVYFSTQSMGVNIEPTVGNTSTTSNGYGAWSLTLTQGISGIFTIEIPPSSVGKSNYYKFSGNIPNTSTATFAQVWSGL